MRQINTFLGVDATERQIYYFSQCISLDDLSKIAAKTYRGNDLLIKSLTCIKKNYSGQRYSKITSSLILLCRYPLPTRHKTRYLPSPAKYTPRIDGLRITAETKIWCMDESVNYWTIRNLG